MGKLINANKYFVESEKVIQIVKERRDELHRTLPANYRLQLAKEVLEKAGTAEEYKALEEKVKELEYEIKFDTGRIAAIPEEYQAKVGFNRVHEEEKLDEELSKQKEILHTLTVELEAKLLPTLLNINDLEKRKLIGKKIDILLDANLYKDPSIPDAMYYANGLSYSGEEERSKQAKKQALKLLSLLKQILKEPSQPNGIQKPSIFQRVLGGKH